MVSLVSNSVRTRYTSGVDPLRGTMASPVLSKIDPNKWKGTTRGVQLEEDLTRIGCMGLYEKPWVFQKGQAVVELLPSGTPRGGHRANPLAWTRELWRDVYSFIEEKDWRPQVDRKLLEEHISSSYDVSECYRSDQFLNKRLRRVVEFLNPIFHPNRRERVTARLATTYIQAFFEISSPDWGLLLEEAIMPQLRAVQNGGCSKTFLLPYLMHLYEYCGCLEPEERKSWKQGMIPQDHSPRAFSQLTGGSSALPVSQQEASSSRSLRNDGKPHRSHRENPPPSRSSKSLTMVEQVAKLSRDVTRDIHRMEIELLEAQSLQRALRKEFGVEDNRDILMAAREVRGELAKVKRDLRVSQKEHLDTKVKAQETMVTLTRLLAKQTSATMPLRDQSLLKKRRRFIPTTSHSSEEDTPLNCSLSEADSSKEWSVKVYKRNRGLPVDLPGKEPINPSPSHKDFMVESPEAMLIDPMGFTPNVPVDTSNLPDNLPLALLPEKSTFPDELSG